MIELLLNRFVLERADCVSRIHDLFSVFFVSPSSVAVVALCMKCADLSNEIRYDFNCIHFIRFRLPSVALIFISFFCPFFAALLFTSHT
jgi:hypothetical protein